jgi:hypothetical protein
MWTNLRLGVRRLMKDRGVSAAAICALALALAAVNTIFTLFNGIFLRPLPLERPDRVVLLNTSVPGRARRFTGRGDDRRLPRADQARRWRRSGARTSSRVRVLNDMVD